MSAMQQPLIMAGQPVILSPQPMQPQMVVVVQQPMIMQQQQQQQPPAAIVNNPAFPHGSNIISYWLDYRDGCCPDPPVYKFYAGNQNNILYQGPLLKSCCFNVLCGEIKVELKDNKGLGVMTPWITQGLCGIEWAVKNLQDIKVGKVQGPTCGQKCSAVFSPCDDVVLLRGTDNDDNDRFTLRSPGCHVACPVCKVMCPDKCCENKKCCGEIKCECCKDRAFDKKFDIYSGDMKMKEPIAAIEFHGTIDGCTGRLKRGYEVRIVAPIGCTYPDACILILMAVFLDEIMLARLREHKMC
jgi:hypothetical protein